MSGTESLSEKILARIALLQSMAAMLPNKKSVLEFICQGLSEVAGINRVDYYIPDNKDSPAQKKDNSSTRIAFPLKHNSILYADLVFHLADPDVFEPYKPYISNFTNMLAVIFEEKAQRELNTKLIAELEQRVTERTKELQVSKERYEQIVERTSDLIISTDSNNYITFINKVAINIFGIPASDCIGTYVFDFVHPDDYEQTEKLIKESQIQHSQSVLFENRLVNKHTQEVTHLLWTVNFQYDSKGAAESVHGIAHNITARKKAEQEHTNYEQQLQQTQKLESLGILAGGIAHDFNNLMGGLYGYIDMAKERTHDPKTSSHLEKAMNTIERARSLTQQLLTFAKGGEPVMKTGNLSPFIEDTARFALSGSNVVCSFDVQEDLWSCNFDKNQIAQVIDNLIINAVQAMPGGGSIIVRAGNKVLGVSEHPFLPKGNYVKISIKDTGAGIPGDLINKIFDPFFSTKSTGHGLGLATCFSIIKRHNGSLEVESAPGRGSCFHILLPAAESIYQADEISVLQHHHGSGLFLVMDDEEVMRDILYHMLQSLGYEVKSTSNGQEAVDFVSETLKNNTPIKGMIFDLTIPGGMGGLEAVQEIRKLTSTIPVFVSSGYTDGFTMKNPSDYGFTASLNKPFRKEDLISLLEKYM